MLIKFIKNMDYNSLIFGQGNVYDIKETEDGFIGRCVRRGHEILESHDGEILVDLRFKEESNKKEQKEEKKEERVEDEKPSLQVEESKELKDESEESESKPKPKRKKRTKKSEK